jgi:hypothetical protein
MTSVTLVHPEDSITIPIHQAIHKCTLFSNNQTLTISPYQVQSPVSLSIFREFITALEGATVNITATNLRGLELLCAEFGFSEFAANLSSFNPPSEDSHRQQIGSPLTEVRKAFLSESFLFIVNGLEIARELHASAALFPAVREQLSVDGCARKFFVKDSRIEAADIDSFQLLLSGERLSNIRSQLLLSKVLGNENLERLFLNCSKTDIRMNLSELMVEKRIDLESVDLSVEALDNLLLSESVTVKSEDALLQFILKLGPGYRDLLRHIAIGFLSEDGLSLLDEALGIPPESVWESAIEQITHSPLPPFDSQIISDFPEIFAEFRKKRFSLLWRGTRDGFKPKEFHRRCDGHPNTLTVFLDTEGNIFGGFTPEMWESRMWNGKSGNDDNCFKADDSLKSFLFTLKNPNNIPARRFALKNEMKHQAIYCNYKCGPHFGRLAMDVGDESNTYMYIYTSIGLTYTNDTGLNDHIVLTGSDTFQIHEIEVFEITD